MNLDPKYEFNNNRLSEQLLLIGRLFNGQKIGMLVINEEGEIIDCNSYCEEIFHIKKENLLRESFGDLFPSHFKEEAIQNHKDFFKKPDFKEIQLDIINSKGYTFPVAITSEITSDYKGHLLRIAGIKVIDKNSKFSNETEETLLNLTEKKLLLYEKLINNTSEGIIITDAPKNGVMPEILFVNTSMCKMSGYTEKELIGKQTSIFNGPESDFSELIRLGECIQEEKSGEFEIINYRKNGTKFWNRFKIMPVFNKNGECVNWISTEEDVTKRKKQIQLLIESENKFRNLVENSAVGIYIITPKGFVFVNEKLAKISGYTRQELYQLDHAKYIHPDDLSSMQERVKNRLLDVELVDEYELRVIKKSGEIIYLEAHGSKIIYQGEPAVIGTVIDITEKKKNADKIRKYTQAIEQSGASIVITNLAGEIEYINPAFCETTGYTAEETIGKNPRFLKSGLTENSVHQDLWQSLNNNKSWTGTFCNKKKNGELYWEHATLSPIFNEKGVKTNYVAVKEDITKRILLESEKENLINEISVSYHELRQFSFIISHNLRAPLTNLMGIIDLADTSEILDATSKSLIEGFKKSTYVLNQTLEDLIKTFIIKESDSENPQMIKFDEVYQNTLLILGLPINKSNAKIAVDFNGAPEAILIKPYIESIFQNMVSNSIKYTQEGIIPEIKISSWKEGNKIHLQFKDNGIGMDMDKTRDRIFGLYQKFHKNENSKGIGLYLVKSHVHAMRGIISVESEINKGTTFTIIFIQ